jgi:hypothetical protein
MLLILADNAIAYRKSKNNSVPLLRACFHVGSHYEFYQEEALTPTRHSYLVGNVTIELARMIDKSIPGQILVGDFNIPVNSKDTGERERIGTAEFVNRARDMAFHLDNVELSGDHVSSIKCYLTGPRHENDDFGINRYHICDKHGLEHRVYNAKINIHRHQKDPIFLGIQDSDMDDFPFIKVEDIVSLPGS